jgi:holo-[acyl-carrier protein] synthase
VGLGAFAFRDVEVVKAPSGAPSLVLTGRAADLAARRGVTSWHVSLTHSGLVAEAVVVAL